jgi:hypothetical protein
MATKPLTCGLCKKELKRLESTEMKLLRAVSGYVKVDYSRNAVG